MSSISTLIIFVFRCIFDGAHNVGVCGDWCVSPCIEGAALSGLAVAEKIHKHARGQLIPKTQLLL